MTLVSIEMQRFGERPITVQRGLTPREAKRALRDAARDVPSAVYNPATATTTTDKYYLRIK